MNPGQLAELVERDGVAAGAELVGSYLIPHVTALRDDLLGHDLAPDTTEFLRGQFVPVSDRVLIDVDAAYAFLGNARASLLLTIGQPDTPGTTLYDSGGAPVDGARWYSMASVNGESAWASTTHRRIVVDVEPGRPVTWQLVGAITGGGETVPVPGPSRLAICPDGTRGYVTSPDEGTVTPIALGRPGYSLDSRLTVQDTLLPAVRTGGRPDRLAVDDTHAVVCVPDDPSRVVVLTTPGGELLHDVAFPSGSPTDCAITPDGAHALVTGSTGHLARLSLRSGEVETAALGGELQGVAIASDGSTAFVADPSQGLVHRVSLPDLEVVGTTTVGERPHVVRVAPDDRVWVLCDPSSGPGLLQGIDPDSGEVVADHALPFPRPSDLAMVPVEGQTSSTVRTAWVVFDEGRYCQYLVGGRFAGQPHSFHHGAFGHEGEGPASVAINDYGEIWVTHPVLDQVWRWPGGRVMCRADEARPHSGVFFGEYCTVSVYGARPPAPDTT